MKNPDSQQVYNHRTCPLDPIADRNYSHAEILVTLRRVRETIEQETGCLSPEQSCLLTDICTRFGNDENDLDYVLGYHVAWVTAPWGWPVMAWEGQR